MDNIPYVIDNIDGNTLAAVLNSILAAGPGGALDIASAYFSIRAYDALADTLPGVGRLRLLLGDEPSASSDIGLRPDPARGVPPGALLRRELSNEPLRAETRQLVEALVRFLRREDVAVRMYLGHAPGAGGARRFLHAKCYLITTSQAIYPVVGIVGSSNFTGPGLTSNRELNLVHQSLHDTPTTLRGDDPSTVALRDLADWYDAQWTQAEDFKEPLIALLENSKFGGREYTPYDIYMKALYEYFKDDLDADAIGAPAASAVELTEFQADAVRKARRILARYDGVLVADSVGLGKTWIGKKLLEDLAYHQRQKALVICPASLTAMWNEQLRSAAIAAEVLSQEQLGQGGFDARLLADVDVVLIDEAHNFRNRLSNRYRALETLLAANGRRGRAGGRKKVILLTATPINNTIFDLYNQINLFAGNDRTYFAAAGIGDLYAYFLAARRDSIEQGTVRIFNLLEEVVIRRTRPFIRRAYATATIEGRRITWPERQLRTVRYDLEATYAGLYERIVERTGALRLPHYNLESYKRPGEERDDFELGREQALVGIFKSRFLKRLESSIDAFRISIRRALEFAKTFDEYVQDGIVLDAAAFRVALRLLAADDTDAVDGGEQTAAANVLPRSRAAAIDTHGAARALIETLPHLPEGQYDRRRLHHDLTADIEALTEIWYAVIGIGHGHDAKLAELRRLLAGDLNGRKVIIFTYYRDTARYLANALIDADGDGDRSADFSQNLRPHVRRIDSSVSPADRVRLVERFAPVAQGRSELSGTEREIDILVATDVLSEGQNLQDCGHLINYDLHWNPTRMVQRAGRIDRLGSTFDTLTIYNMFPEAALEDLLGLVKRLTEKIDTINQTGFLDASILGEVVTPRDFNTLRRIAAEDNAVIEEQESFLDLASGEAMRAQLQRLLADEAGRWVTDLDDGIHSGLHRSATKGIFFYFTAHHPDGGRSHFWRYYDAQRRQIVDNRYEILQLIACASDTPRFPPPYDEIDVYAIQERVIEHIVGYVEQQVAATVVAKPVAPEQAVAAAVLRQHLANPAMDREELRSFLAFLKTPLVGTAVRALRDALRDASGAEPPAELVALLRTLFAEQGAVPIDRSDGAASPAHRLERTDLRLMCYEYISA